MDELSTRLRDVGYAVLNARPAGIEGAPGSKDS
jgi:hypothetical protein